jgi:SnoaL-like domain
MVQDEMSRGLTCEAMEQRIRGYFDDCNAGDVDRIAANFEPDGIHYFPPGTYEGPFRGARTIGEKWRTAVQVLGSYWTVDTVICDPNRRRAVIEWTHFKRSQGVILRGDEWYEFSPHGLIREIRAYYASPQDSSLKKLELGGFDYGGRGYPLKAPAA